MASMTLLVSKNFSSSHWNSNFFREGFVRIISFIQSNEHTHTTRSLHFRIQNVIQWWFLSLETKNQPGSVKINSKREFWKMTSLTLLVSKKIFQVTETQNFFRKALLGSYLSNKVTNTLIRRVVCILESKTWSSGDFWALRPKINLVQSKSIQKESFGRWLLWLCRSLNFFFQAIETR